VGAQRVPRRKLTREPSFAYAAVLAPRRIKSKDTVLAVAPKLARDVLRLALQLQQVGARSPLHALAVNIAATTAVNAAVQTDTKTAISAIMLALSTAPRVRLQHVALANGDWLGLAPTFAKLLVWNLTQYERVLLLYGDLFIRRSLEHLFWLEGTPAAVAQAQFPPQTMPVGAVRRAGAPFVPFNSGLMLLTPSAELLARMLAARERLGSWDGSDQGFLAHFFFLGDEEAAGPTPWFELPRTYNLYGCPQTDEIAAAHAWHLNGGFRAGFANTIVRKARADYDRRVSAALGAARYPLTSSSRSSLRI